MNKKQLCQMLSEVGFISSRYMMFDQAEKLHGAIEAAYPNTEAPVIGEAYNLVCQQLAEEAVVNLKKFIDKKQEDVSDLLRGFLGLALFENGMINEAETVLKKVNQGEDPIAKSMASDLLNMMSNQG